MIIESNPYTPYMDRKNLMHFVRVYGPTSADFKENFFKNFTYDWQEYDDDTGSGDWWKDIPDVKKMKESIQNKEVRSLFKDVGVYVRNVSAEDRFDGEGQTFHFNLNHSDQMCVRNVSRLGLLPVQLLSATFPDLEMEVMTVDNQGRSACFRITEGYVEKMPKSYVQMVDFETPLICDMKIDGSLRPEEKAPTLFEKLKEPLGGNLFQAQIGKNLLRAYYKDPVALNSFEKEDDYERD